jgi:hypothetical protein
MSAKWIRLESDIVDHPKTGRLETALSEPLAGWYVIRALSWMSRFCPTGHVRDNDGTSLESSAKWRGPPGELLAALVSCGWLDSVDDGWEWHDWAEHQGKVAHKAAKERERKAAYRRRTAQPVPRDNDGTSAGRPAQRDVTGRDVTGRDVEIPQTASAPSKRRQKKADKPTDPRHAPLVAELVEVYASARNGAKYPFGPRDARAVSTLLAQAAPDVVARAWRRALAHQGFPTVATLSELSAHLAHFVADAAPGRGPIPAESVDWTQQQTGEVPL